MMRITVTLSQLADIATELMNRDIIDDFTDIRQDYIGRYMYDNECIGIVTGVSGFTLGAAMTEIFTKLNDANDDNAEWETLNIEDWIGVNEDSMGRSNRIFYWLGITAEKI